MLITITMSLFNLLTLLGMLVNLLVFISDTSQGLYINYQKTKERNHNKLIGQGISSDYNWRYVQFSDLTQDEKISYKTVMKYKKPLFKLSAQNLPSELTSESDPYVEVYLKRFPGNDTFPVSSIPKIQDLREYELFYTTESVDNALNVSWDEVIQFSDYKEGTGQIILFKVCDNNFLMLDEDLGEVFIRADEIMELETNLTVYLEYSGENSTLTIIPWVDQCDLDSFEGSPLCFIDVTDYTPEVGY